MLKKIIILFMILLANYHQVFSFPIPDSGQTKCYDNNSEILCPKPDEDYYGQDGNYIINPSSYKKLDAKCETLPYTADSWVMVKDNVTGLIWENKTDDNSIHDKDNTYSWYDAQDVFIKNLNTNAFGGATDWRLPTIKELASITNLKTYEPAIDKNFFYNNCVDFYWTSTTSSSYTNISWRINFYSGHDSYDFKSSPYYVTAVRGVQSKSIDHLVVNNDGTITDIDTGLMWQVQVSDIKKNWKDALSYCENLVYAEYSDWRLPDREELRSIVNYSNKNPAIFEQFNDTMLEYYWSSTTNANYASSAWGIDFKYGDDSYSRHKSSEYYVRAVRGGQCRLSGNLVILSPKQGEILDSGKDIQIIWDNADISENVNILLAIDGGKTFQTIAEGTENDGMYEWTVNDIYSANCVLKIEPVSQPDNGNSQGLFSIFSHPALIKGYVTDQSTNSPNLNVTVSINNQTTQTDLNGYYEIEITRPGSYNIFFSKSGYEPKELTNTTIKSGENFINAKMIQTGSVSGIISDKWGKIIYDVSVSISDKTVISDNLGKYQINDLLPGNVTITFTHSDYYSLQKNIEIKAGQTTIINITLNKSSLLNIETQDLPDAEVGDEYEKEIMVNGETPFEFRLKSGNLPPNLSLDSKTGILKGELTTSGSFIFNIRVDDASGSYAEREFIINVIDPFNILTLSLARGTKDQEYCESILASGGTPPYTFTIKSGSFPSNLTLSKTGKITGKPIATGQNNLNIQVIDSENRIIEREFFIQIVDPISIQTDRLHDGIVDSQFNQVLSAAGGYGDYTWSIYSGTLPDGIIIDNNAHKITGYPKYDSYRSIVLSVSDSDGRIAYRDFTLHIASPLAVPMSNLPNALKNESYYEAIPLNGGIKPYIFTCDGLPPNLIFNAETNIISGISTISGFNNVNIQVSDSSWPVNQKVIMKTGIRTTSMLTILTNAVLPTGKQDVPVDIPPLMVSGTSSFYEWTCVKGYLPAGIELDSSNSTLTGTPIGAGTNLFTLSVKNDQNQTAEKQFIWHIIKKMKIITQNLPDAAKNIDYKHVLEASGGIPPYEWHLKTDELPSGLLLNNSGIIYGNPNNLQTKFFTLEVNDSDEPSQKIEKTFSIGVFLDDLYIYTPDIPNSRIMQPYFTSIKALSGQLSYNWNISGELPSGLFFNKYPEYVTLEGTPTKAGNYEFTINVQDSSIPYAEESKTYSITIYDTLNIQTTKLKSAQIDVAYNDIIKVNGGISPYVLRIIDGNLPNGLKLNPSNGELSGTIIDSDLDTSTKKISELSKIINESNTFTIQVEDSGIPSEIAEKTLNISISNELVIFTEILPQARQNVFFTTALEGTGGLLPYKWQLLNEGKLPKCMTLNSTTGIIHGRPEKQGTFYFSISLTDHSTPVNSSFYSYSFIVTSNNSFLEGDLNNDNKINLQDIIISLHVFYNALDSFDGWIDINHDCQLGLQEILYLMQLIAH